MPREPLERVGEWLDERTGWRAAVRSWVDSPPATGPVLGRILGTAVASTVAVLALSGLVLMTAYAPAPQAAWASVHYVQFVQERGWVIRGLHYWAAQALIVVGALHVFWGAMTGSYRKRGEIGWWLTLLVLGMAIAQGITGGLLPWDQRGWWARVVEGNIVGLAPVVGGWIQQMMSGGAELGALGLARAFTLHVIVLPLVIVMGLAFRGGLARRVGGDVAGVRSDPASALAGPVAVAVLMVFVLFGLTGTFHGAPLDGPADPMADYPARPEWFLLTLFQLRKFFHGAGEFWGTTLVPGAAAGYLLVLPWIDRPPRSRALVTAPVLAIFGGAAVLSTMAYVHDARDAQYQKMRKKADQRAQAAIEIATRGVPPGGPLEMMRRDPGIRGREVFDQHCASCHLLGDLGDPKKATATKLDGWGTPEWFAAMMHDPDAPEYFGRGPYKGQMPSVDVRPKDKPAGEPWTPMIKSDAEKRAVVLFLASQGDEPGDPARPVDEATRALGEKIVSERCTTCHLYKGEGDDEGSGTAPELAHVGSLAWTRAQVASPASPQTYREKALDPDMKKHMPRFDTELSASDIDFVARYTRATARGVPIR